jgi:hypothetical protein
MCGRYGLEGGNVAGSLWAFLRRSCLVGVEGEVGAACRETAAAFRLGDVGSEATTEPTGDDGKDEGNSFILQDNSIVHAKRRKFPE